MIYVLIVILTSSSFNIIFKIFEKLGVNTQQAVIINYIVAVAIGLFLSPISYSPAEIVSQGWFYCGLALGISFFVSMMLYARSTSIVGVALTTLLTRTSLVIPTTLAFLLFGEEFTMRTLIAVVLILISLFFIVFSKSAPSTMKKEHSKWLLLIMPVMVFMMSGFNDSMIKSAQFYFIRDNMANSTFITVVFATALIYGLADYVITGKYKNNPISYKAVIGGLVIGAINVINSHSILEALKGISASVVFPIVNIGIVLLSSFVGILLFKERLTKGKSIGIVLAIIAIAILYKA